MRAALGQGCDFGSGGSLTKTISRARLNCEHHQSPTLALAREAPHFEGRLGQWSIAPKYLEPYDLGVSALPVFHPNLLDVIPRA